MTHRKKRYLLAASLLSAAVFSTVAFWSGLTIASYRISARQLHAPVRLAVITDLHSGSYGKNQKNLLQALDEVSPDAVLLVGDIVDDKRPQAAAMMLLQAVGKCYSSYYVSGNHEWYSGEMTQIKEAIQAADVTVLDGNSEGLQIGSQTILIAGVDDPEGFSGRYDNELPPGKSWQQQLEQCAGSVSEETFSLLLSHRPEYASIYSTLPFDLILCGHAHGGQVRIPGLLNGLLSPGEGFFPQYAGGQYDLGANTMIVSRGLCRNWIPRIFNPPELVIVDLMPTAE